MKESFCRCHPVQCIVPPHMVESIKKRGNSNMRKMADALDKQAGDYRDARVVTEPPESFIAASAIADEVELSPNRKVYDGNKKVGLPGTLIRSEVDEAGNDPAVNAAFDGSGDTFYLYADIYRRNSLDGNGMELISTVHHRRNYNNAFWNGQQMVYGDGDGILFRKLTALSVIGHELSHGVVQFSGGLVYRDQSGALNESFADIFGALTEQYKAKQDACEATWLIGDGILGPDINGIALRSMKAPGTAYEDDLLGKDPQPYHMNLYVNTSSDNGGVHINSGIPNHAFYLLANYLGGQAWEKAGHIWYDTMQAINNPLATFTDWADKTVEIARERFGSGSIEMQFTRRAWKLVGISV